MFQGYYCIRAEMNRQMYVCVRALLAELNCADLMITVIIESQRGAQLQAGGW